MSANYFGGAFFAGGFFGDSPAPTVKKGSNWKKRQKDDEQVIIAFIQAYMQHDYRERRNYHG